MGRVVAGLGIRECASSTSARRLCVNPGNWGTVLTELAFRPLHCGLTFSREPAFPRNLPSPLRWHQVAAQVRAGGSSVLRQKVACPGAVLTVGVCLAYGVLAEVLCLFSVALVF